MNGVFKKTLFIILSICLLSSFSLALENEYKNSLTKVELTKTGESSYSVNLYTQKKYSEPLKVIKKSDLNYYKDVIKRLWNRYKQNRQLNNDINLICRKEEI